MKLNQDRILELYGSGKTAREIAQELGCSKSGVILCVRRAGYFVRPAQARDYSGSANGNWKGGRYLTSDGYVRVWTPNGHVLEHRLAVGAKPGEIVHHKNSLCRQDNQTDNLKIFESHREHRLAHVEEERRLVEAGLLASVRFPPPSYGIDNGRAKLTESEVVEIRARRALGEAGRALAREFGVSHANIRKIVRGLSWTSLTVREFPTLRESAKEKR